MDYREEIKKILLKLPCKRQVVFALECANDVKHLMEDPKSLKALKIVEKWLRGEATKEEVKEAADSAYSAAHATIYYTAASIAYATVYAVYAAHDAAKAQNIDIKHYYDKLLSSLTELERECYEVH